MTKNQADLLSRLTSKATYLPESPVDKRTLITLVKNGHARPVNLTGGGVGYQRTADGAKAARSNASRTISLT